MARFMDGWPNGALLKGSNVYLAVAWYNKMVSLLRGVTVNSGGVSFFFRQIAFNALIIGLNEGHFVPLFLP